VATTPYSAADRAYFEPSSTAQTFRQGEMIGINAAGYATKLDDTASLMFAGIRDATVDLVVASGGSNGDYPDIPVETPRYFQMKIASAAVTDKGRPVFALYSNEVSFNAGSYKNYVGIVRDVISSTVVEVEAAYLTPKVVITYRYNAPSDSKRPLQGGCPGDGGRRDGGCPCRENGSRPALLDRPADQSEQPLASQWLAPIPAPLFDGPAASALGSSSWDTPPPAARDILRLLSRLRC
jgi:hypothetical protein